MYETILSGFHPDVLSLFFFTREYYREEASRVIDTREDKEGIAIEKGGKLRLHSVAWPAWLSS